MGFNKKLKYKSFFHGRQFCFNSIFILTEDIHQEDGEIFTVVIQ